MNFEPALGSPSTGVIVTGGASGLGLASAQALAAVGRSLALWDLDGEKATSAAKALAERFRLPGADPHANAPAVRRRPARGHL